MEQKRKSLLVLSLVLVLGLSGSAFAGDVWWDAGPSGTGTDWTSSENWAGDIVPTNTDYGMIDDPTVTQPIIVTGQNATAGRVVIGQTTQGTVTVTGGTLTSLAEHFTVGRSVGGDGTLNINGGDVIANEGLITANNADATGTVNMTGGTLTVHASSDPAVGLWYRKMLTIGDSGPGIFNMDGGAVTVDMDIYLAFRSTGSGNLNMTGGTIDVAGTIYADYNIHGSVTGIWGSGAAPGVIQLDGGVITASDLVMTANGLLDVSGDGMMILAGDDRSVIDGYIANGWITGAECTYDGTNTTIAVPEPATMVLLGLGGLLSLRRRRTN